MKKKLFSLIAFVLMTSVILTGCVQYVVEIDVNNNLNADVKIKTGILKDVKSFMSENSKTPVDPFEDTKKEAEEDGLKTEDYSDENYEGIIVSTTIKDICNPEDSKTTNGYAFTKDGNVLKFSAKSADLTKNLTDGSSMSIDDMAQYGDMDLRLIIKFPCPAGNNNATTVSEDKKTLEWDLTKSDGEFFAEANLSDGGISSTVIIIIVAAILLIAAVVIAIALSKSKNKKDAENFVPKEEKTEETPVETPVEETVEEITEENTVEETPFETVETPVEEEKTEEE